MENWEPQRYVEAIRCPRCGADQGEPCHDTPTMHQERVHGTLAVEPTYAELRHENYRLRRVASAAQAEADMLRLALQAIKEEHEDIPALVAFIDRTLNA